MANPYFIYPMQPRPAGYPTPPYMPNGQSVQAPPSGMPSNAAPLLPNNGRVIQSGPVRVLCVADVRGKAIYLPGAITLVLMKVA